MIKDENDKMCEMEDFVPPKIGRLDRQPIHGHN